MRSPGFFSRFCFRTRVDGYGVFFRFSTILTWRGISPISRKHVAQAACARGGGRHRRIVTRTAGAMQAAHAGRARRPRAAGARGPKRCMYIDHCNHVYTDPDRRRSVWVLAPALSLSSRPGLMPGLWKVCGPLYCTSTVQRLGTGADALSAKYMIHVCWVLGPNSVRKS